MLFTISDIANIHSSRHVLPAESSCSGVANLHDVERIGVIVYYGPPIPVIPFSRPRDIQGED